MSKLEVTMPTLESELVRDFESIVLKEGNVFSIEGIAFEFDYRSGKVDVIAKNQDGELIAFEAKLERWRDALNQAYRNTSFAHYSYVVLPESSSSTRAVEQYHEFECRGVGLCSVSEKDVKIEIYAPRNEPLQPWLTGNALNVICEQ